MRPKNIALPPEDQAADRRFRVMIHTEGNV